MGKYSMWLYPFMFFFFFFFILPSLSYVPHNHLCPYEQSLALLQFKQNFSIEKSASSECASSSQPKTMSWRRGTDCCRWDGVTCDGLTGHVIELDLSCSQLDGIIHSNSTLFHLSHLKRLNLAHNNFDYSPISHQFGQFATTLTHLNLSDSVFSGHISSNIWHLSKLLSLDLSHNPNLWMSHNFLQNLTHLRELSLSLVKISSAVPMNLSSSLTLLDLSSTGLHGNLTDSIFHLPNLQTLDLSDNPDLIDHFPEVNVSSPLRRLDLSFTSLHGQVPDSIGYFKSLNYLQLQGCEFSGSIPESLGNLTRLTYLDISANNFSGEIPSTLSNLDQLTSLYISRNNFSGEIPYFNQLTFLDISRNNFSGEIPSTLSNLGQLTYLDISYNNFSGEIPSTLSNLNQLTSLDISFNNLGGHIPNAVGKLKHLNSLSLFGNHFSGPFPCSIANLTQLVRLDLSSHSLTGPLPSNIVGLQNLTYLDLSDNSFNETIPYWLFALPSLEYVNINHNRFTDIVDLQTFSNLTNLSFLDLSYNNLSVTTTNINVSLPNLYFLGLASCKMEEFPYMLKHSPNLDELDLSYNQIQGQLSIWSLSMLNDTLDSLHLRSNLLQGPLPSSICNFKSLKVLDLSSNNFSGTIPQCLGNFSDNLSVLDLRTNLFHGTIPTTFGTKANCWLQSLNLHGNQLEGMLPPSLANCKQLQLLDLGNNQLNDTFPHWLGTLPQLQVLVLRYNRFHGPITTTSKTKLPFRKLRIIDLSHNQFTGFLPSRYFRNFKAMMNVGENEFATRYISSDDSSSYYDEITVVLKGVEIHLVRIQTVLANIDLSCNKFEGEIPNFIGNLKSLRELNLSHNSLTGYIPSVLGNLLVIESLDLSYNQLVGEIPMQLTGLTFLEVINVSQNHLMGRIPQGNQFSTFQNDSYSGNSGLCGLPLSKECGDDKIPQPPIFEEKDESNMASGFTWKVVILGYGCGTVFGLVMGGLMFLAGEPKWFVEIAGKGLLRNVKRPMKRGHKRYARRN